MSHSVGRRILLDAYWWNGGPPSGRNVVRSMTTAWSHRFPEDDLTLAVRAEDAADVRAQLSAADIRASVFSVPRWARIHSLAARSLGRRSLGFDAVVTQNFATRTRGARSCVLVHDAMYVEHPGWFTPAERAYFSRLRPSLRDAETIFTTSAIETQRIARLWPETRSRLTRIGLAVPIDFALSPGLRPAAVDEDERFVLVVGRLNVRKNLRRLIDAFCDSPGLARSHRLVVVGEADGRNEDLALTGAEADRVSFLGRIGDPELRWLYTHCDLFAFASLDEGYGLPLLEARSCGARIAASNLAVFRELGVVDVFFEPRSTADIERALGVALSLPKPHPDPELAHGWDGVVERMRAAVTPAVDDRNPHVSAA
jgi:glycosyltransferase involved in cell wall biosynthesis